MEERPRRGGRRSPYHHGDLRRALVDSALEIIAERGIEGLSMAEAARRSGVSPGAPYRHFATSTHLLAAAAAKAAKELTDDLREAVASHQDDCSKLAEAAGAYVRFFVRYRAGFDLIFADGLEAVADVELRDAGRGVMDQLIPAAMAVSRDDGRAALELVEQIVAAAHGYGVLYLTGFLRGRAASIDALAGRAQQVTRKLVRSAAES
jgi:AcrR family transcriptional regulator